MSKTYYRCHLSLKSSISIEYLFEAIKIARQEDCDLWLEPSKKDENGIVHKPIVIKTSTNEGFDNWNNMVSTFLDVGNCEIVEDFTSETDNLLDLPATAIVDIHNILNILIESNKDSN